MAYQYAGMYGPEAILDQTGGLATGTSVTVYLHGTTTLAQLYLPTVTGGIQTLPVPLVVGNQSANPVVTDSLGNLIFWVAPGVYDLAFTIQGVATTRTVVVRADPAESGLIAPVFRARIQNAFSIPTAYAAVLWDTVTVDNMSGYNAATGVYTVPSAGAYMVSAVVKLGSGQATSTTVNLEIYNNGTPTWGNGQNFNPGPFQGAYASDLLQMAAGQSIQVMATASVASPLQVDAPSGNVIYIYKVSD